MEPPLKRPRLSIFGRHVPDAELEEARYLNDMSLKSRFEAIFSKYSQDFTDIGDEIDLSTGEILVNNGHIETMAGETDTGEFSTPIQGAPALSGKSLLRAMTVLPEREDIYHDNPVSDEIIASIETMAQNAALVGDVSMESEDDLFETRLSKEAETTDNDEGRRSTSYTLERANYCSSESDADSLFEGKKSNTRCETRSSTPDSLFHEEEDREDREDNVGVHGHESHLTSASANALVNLPTDDEAIIEKFGHEVGHEVLDLLQQRRNTRDLHLEPAWRIPVDIGPLQPAEKASTPALPTSKERELSDQPNISLWGAKQTQPRQRRRQRKCIVQEGRSRRRKQKRLFSRDESEDPLQEDFSSDVENVGRDKVSHARLEDTKYSKGENVVLEGDEIATQDQASNGGRASCEDEESPNQTDESEDSDASGKFGVQLHGYEYPEHAESDSYESGVSSCVRFHRAGIDTESAIPLTDRHSSVDSQSTASPEDDGQCSFCNQQFSCKSSVMAHWDRLIRKPPANLGPDDPHNLPLIRAARGLKPARVRGPRLTQADFRTMVELHEGGGLTFEEIVDTQALRTRKSAAQLQDIYDRHRIVPGVGSCSEDPEEPWTAEEDRLLNELCKNPLITLATLKRHLRERDEIDIGNRLANAWLRQLGGGSSLPHGKGAGSVSNACQRASQGLDRESRDSSDISIKSEDD